MKDQTVAERAAWCREEALDLLRRRAVGPEDILRERMYEFVDVVATLTGDGPLLPGVWVQGFGGISQTLYNLHNTYGGHEEDVQRMRKVILYELLVWTVMTLADLESEMAGSGRP